MNSNSLGNATTKQLRTTMQVIAGAMISGVMVFGLITLFITMGKEAHGGFISYIAIGLGAAMLAARLAVPNLIAKTQIDAIAHDEEKMRMPESDLRRELLRVYQAQMVVGYGLLESGCFINLVVYILEVQVPTLVVTAFLLAMMISTFPARDRVDHWIDDRLRVMKS